MVNFSKLLIMINLDVVVSFVQAELTERSRRNEQELSSCIKSVNISSWNVLGSISIELRLPKDCTAATSLAPIALRGHGREERNPRKGGII